MNPPIRECLQLFESSHSIAGPESTASRRCEWDCNRSSSPVRPSDSSCWPERCCRRRLPPSPRATLLWPKAPPGDGVTLVNEGEEFIERKGDGRFIARPIFDRELDIPYYGVRDPDTGEWLAGMYRIQGAEKERRDGWERIFQLPTCGCSRSRTPAPVNSMEQRRCEEAGPFVSSTGRSIPSSTSAPLYQRTRPPC